MVEEQKAFERERAKQEKVENFKAQIDKKAQQQLRQKLDAQKKEQELKKLKEREQMLKSREYAAA